MLYKIIDELNEPPINEYWLRRNLYSLAVNTLSKSEEEMLSGELSAKLQFEDIYTAIDGPVAYVIEALKEHYGLEVELCEDSDDSDDIIICPHCNSKQEGKNDSNKG